jgi:CRP/FNR family transcriptional regulator, cyclic AMP receptor protein
MKPEESASLLGATPLFADLEPEDLLRLAADARQRIYPKGHFVFQQGEAGDALFVMLAGSVQVVRTSAGGAETLLATLSPPDVFGELALVDGGRRSSSARTVDTARVLALDRRTVLDLMASTPAATDALLRSVGRLVRRTSQQPGDLVFLDLPGRAAKLLVALIARTPPNPLGDVVLDLKKTQSELGAALGCARPAVNNYLAQFQHRGYVSVEGTSVLVKNVDALSKRAGTQAGAHGD